MCIYIQMYVYLYSYVCIHTYMSINIHICVYIQYTHICVCTCIYNIYRCIYIYKWRANYPEGRVNSCWNNCQKSPFMALGKSHWKSALEEYAPYGPRAEDSKPQRAKQFALPPKSAIRKLFLKLCTITPTTSMLVSLSNLTYLFWIKNFPQYFYRGFYYNCLS